MRKHIFIAILSIIVLGCKTVESNYSDSNIKEEIRYRYIDKINVRDSVIIKDSVVIHPDGTKSSFNSKEKFRTEVEKKIIEIRVEVKKTITKRILTTKTVRIRDFFWWTGLIFYILLFIFVLIKLSKKFKL
jgi:hypothetical protein